MPTKAERYNYDHVKERERWEQRVASGDVECHAILCHQPTRLIDPNEPWDLGHNTAGTAWTGPEHQFCNRSDGGTRNKGPKPQPASMDW